jgi:hypothetical protein
MPSPRLWPRVRLLSTTSTSPVPSRLFPSRLVPSRPAPSRQHVQASSAGSQDISLLLFSRAPSPSALKEAADGSPNCTSHHIPEGGTPHGCAKGTSQPGDSHPDNMSCTAYRPTQTVCTSVIARPSSTQPGPHLLSFLLKLWLHG